MSGLSGGRLFAREVERFPGTLLAICLLLLAISMMILRSASLTPDGGMMHYAARQMIWGSAGLAVFLGVSMVPYPWLGRRGWILYLAGIVALLLVFVIGTKVNGSRRWFSFGPVRVQPSEFVKYMLVVVLAHVIARRGDGRRETHGS